MEKFEKKCIVCNKIFTKPITCSKETWEIKRKFCSPECGYKDQIGRIPSQETREKMSIAAILSGNKPPISYGKNHPNWKGGVTSLHQLLRCSIEMKEWRQSIFERDDWTCKVCHERGGELNAHHIKKFSDYPELRLDINNGITLCYDCHQETKWCEEDYEEEFYQLIGIRE